VSLFFAPAPLLLKQAYLVWTGVVTAFLFTYVPEWTGWVLLAAMALYDLAAVLAPGGPLKVGEARGAGLANGGAPGAESGGPACAFASVAARSIAIHLSL
jgi:hypothetical protein